MALRVTEEELRLFRSKLVVEHSSMPTPEPRKNNKFRNRKTILDDKVFDSKGEAMRYWELQTMQSVGLITGLKEHVPFSIDINGKHVCKYYADFVYCENGVQIVEDFKGFETDCWRLKKKLVAAVLGVEIKTVRKGVKKRRREPNL